MFGFRHAAFLFSVVQFFGELSRHQSKSSEPFCTDPFFAEPVRNFTVAAGRDITLSCIVENVGNCKVAWMHTDRHTLLTLQDQVIARDLRYSITHNSFHTWWLHISDVREEDAGEYMCQINTSPMMSSIGYLVVVVPPIIVEELTSSDMEVREGNSVYLRCCATGNPEPHVSWRREDGVDIVVGRKTVPNVFGEFLNITKVSRSHMGAYLCIAKNGVQPSVSKRIILHVLFTPMLWIPSQLVGVPVDSDVVLICNLESSPPSVTHWLKNDDPLLPGETAKYNASVVEKSNYKFMIQLKIIKTQPEDFGSYTCVARNELGKTEGTIRLYGTQQPKTEDVQIGAWQNTGTKHTKEVTEITTGSLQPATLPNTRIPITERKINSPTTRGHSTANSSSAFTADRAFVVLLILSALSILRLH